MVLCFHYNINEPFFLKEWLTKIRADWPAAFMMALKPSHSNHSQFISSLCYRPLTVGPDPIRMRWVSVAAWHCPLTCHHWGTCWLLWEPLLFSFLLHSQPGKCRLKRMTPEMTQGKSSFGTVAAESLSLLNPKLPGIPLNLKLGEKIESRSHFLLEMHCLSVLLWWHQMVSSVSIRETEKGLCAVCKKISNSSLIINQGKCWTSWFHWIGSFSPPGYTEYLYL